MKYCVYLTVYSGSLLPKRYIGSSSLDKILKGYNGTIKSKKYKLTYKLEQQENKHLFKTKILSHHSSRKQALEEELRLHIKYDVVKSDDYMNMALASPNGYFGRDITGENHPRFGKKSSDKTRKLIKEIMNEKVKNGTYVSPFSNMDHSGKNNGFFGKTHSEETKLKMRKPKKYVPKFRCPHCEKEYDAGNLKQHLKRVGYEED